MELPKGWKLLSFSEAFKDRTGGQQKIKKNDYLASGNLPIIDQGQQFVAGFTNNLNFQCNIELPCILFGDHTKKFKFVEKPFALGADGVKVLETNKNIDTKFAFHYLQTLYLPDVGYSRHFRFLKRTVIPVPPIASQRRIANILDKADEIVRKRKEAIALTEQLQKSIFLDMFGDPVINPKGWEVVELGKLIIGKPNNGIFRKNDEYGGKIPVIWVKELFSGSILNTKNSISLDPTEQEIKKFGLKKGDILFCRSSLKLEGVGYNNVFDDEDDSALFECHIIRVSPNQSKINSIFLNYLLRTEGMRKVIISKSNTVTMSTIGQEQIKTIPVILPPKKNQDDFDKQLRYLIKLMAKKRFFLQESENLFNSLLQKAFKGEL
jgi:type I restriction enzyme S subunit